MQTYDYTSIIRIVESIAHTKINSTHNIMYIERFFLFWISKDIEMNLSTVNQISTKEI